VKVDTLKRFVFVNLDPNAEPLLDFLDPIPSMLSAYHLDQMRFRGYQSTILPANWKAVVDAFNEAYHVQGTHPQILPWTDDVSIAYEQLGIHAHYGRLPEARRELRPSPRLGLTADQYDEGEILAGLVAGLGRLFLKDEMAIVDELRAQPSSPDRNLLVEYQQRRRELLESRGLDVSGLGGVISIDVEARTADVQGMCTYEALVDATLPHGLIPYVVPQLRTITLGGAVSGLGQLCEAQPVELARRRLPPCAPDRRSRC